MVVELMFAYQKSSLLRKNDKPQCIKLVYSGLVYKCTWIDVF